MAPVNNIERRAAKKLAASDGINYTEALRRIRSSGIAPSSVLNGSAVTESNGTDQLVDRMADAIETLGGTIKNNNPFDYKALLTELLATSTHPKLANNMNVVLSQGTATGRAQAVNGLIRVLAQWGSEKKRSESVDLKTLSAEANGSLITGWSLGNLLEEMDTSVPLAGYTIDLEAEKDWTELSSRVDYAMRYMPPAEAAGSNIRQMARGMAAMGLASLHGVTRGPWLMIDSGWQAKVSEEQQEKITKHGKEFVEWAGAADNVEEIIRAAVASRSLDPEVIKSVMDEN